MYVVAAVCSWNCYIFQKYITVQIFKLYLHSK